MPGFSDLFQFVEGVARTYNYYQENRLQKDLMGELSYLQDALRVERELVMEVREDLFNKTREAEQYWDVLKAEGYIMDGKGGILKCTDEQLLNMVCAPEFLIPFQDELEDEFEEELPKPKEKTKNPKKLPS